MPGRIESFHFAVRCHHLSMKLRCFGVVVFRCWRAHSAFSSDASSSQTSPYTFLFSSLSRMYFPNQIFSHAISSLFSKIWIDLSPSYKIHRSLSRSNSDNLMIDFDSSSLRGLFWSAGHPRSAVFSSYHALIDNSSSDLQAVHYETYSLSSSGQHSAPRVISCCLVSWFGELYGLL